MRAPLFLLFFLPALAFANPAGLWYNPERDGLGLWLTQDMGGGHWVQWQLYRRDGSTAVVVGAEGCTEFPCVVPLHEPRAQWLGGNLDFGAPVGMLELHVTENGLRLEFDLRQFDPANCVGVSPGGVIFNKCIGTLELELLAR